MVDSYEEKVRKFREQQAAKPKPALHVVGPAGAVKPERTLADAVQSGMAHLAKGPPVNPVLTGFRDFDLRITPLEPKQLTILGADQGSGKSTAALQITLRAAAKGHSVVYLNLEMPEESLGIRTVANYAQVPTGRVFRGEAGQDEWTRITNAAKEIWGPSHRIALGNRSDHAEAGAAARFCAQARETAAKRGEPLALIVVDHALMLSMPGNHRDVDSAGKARADWLKNLAEANNCHVLALLHITRAAATQGSMPSLNQLASSAWFARHADNVWILHTPRGPDHTFTGAPTKLACQKGRYGDTPVVELEYRCGVLWPWTLYDTDDGGGRRL